MILRSGGVTIALLALALIGLALGWRAHTRGRFAKLKAELNQRDTPHAALPPRPGGQDALVLERSAIEGGTVPEFLSATLLPGRGMNILQITAALPGKGIVKLLDSPSLDEAARILSGQDEDAHGAQSLKIGGAIESPWAGDLFGTASPDGLNTSWHGMSLSVPAMQRNGVAVATGGLLLASSSSAIKNNFMPDGAEAEAVYEAGDYDGHWPSTMRLTATTQLSARSIEMRVTALNTGKDPQPVGLGWRPRFALQGDRAQVTLRLPAAMREEIRDSRTGAPTGHLLPVEGTRYDFNSHTGVALGSISLDDTFAHLHQAPLDSGPIVELRDTQNDYGLRITMLSSSIKAIHVEAPADGKSILIEPRFNYDDPFGREWAQQEDTGMVTLQPGRSVQWRIRFEIFSLTAAPVNQP